MLFSVFPLFFLFYHLNKDIIPSTFSKDFQMNNTLSSNDSATATAVNVTTSKNANMNTNHSIEQSSSANESDILTDLLVKDEPKISNAIKNFMSILIAESLNPSVPIPSNPIQSFSQSPSFWNTNLIAPAASLSQQECLLYARMLVKKLNEYVLPDIVEWGHQNKQKVNQSGEFVCSYLIHFLILQMCTSASVHV